jgi:hypothetical protein
VSQLFNRHLFFQLSRRIFLEFFTFNTKFFRILKFRAEFFSARELSSRKNLGEKNFGASVPGAIGRAGFCRSPYPQSEKFGQQGVFPDFAAIVRKFLEFSTFGPEKIRELRKNGGLVGSPGHIPVFL